MLRRLLLSATIAASFASVPLAAGAQVYVQVAPPPPRHEVAPPPRRGQVWVPGYSDWRRNRHVWVGGHWVRARPGYVYREPRWVERDGRWAMERGRWNRGDRDGDGVPNRRDPYPNNPRR
jgi:hypothetical protein